MACGGVGSKGKMLSEVGLLHLDTLTWHLRRSKPSLARVNHYAGYTCGSVYLFGGSWVEEGVPPASNQLHADANGISESKVEAPNLISPLVLRCTEFVQKASLLCRGDPLQFVAVRLSPHVITGMAEAFTIEIWVFPTSTAASGPILCRTNAQMGCGFGIIAVDSDAGKVNNGQTLCAFVGCLSNRTEVRIPVYEWSHVAAAWDSENKGLSVYRNGVLVDSLSFNVAPDEISNGPAELTIGALPGKAAWQGCIDEVRLWGKPLPLEEVRAGMNVLPDRSASRLLGLWTFNEGSGHYCVDASVQANHGFIEGEMRRVMSGRHHIDPALTESEKYIEMRYAELMRWKADFAQANGREATKADILMADREVLSLARRYDPTFR